MFPEGKGTSSSNILLTGNLGFHRDAFRWGLHGLLATQFLSKQESWGVCSTQTHSKNGPGKLRGNFREQPRMKKLKEPKPKLPAPPPLIMQLGGVRKAFC